MNESFVGPIRTTLPQMSYPSWMFPFWRPKDDRPLACIRPATPKKHVRQPVKKGKRGWKANGAIR